MREDHFWATVYDAVGTDYGEQSVMTTELLSLKLAQLVKQCKADGVQKELIDANLDNKADLVRLCVEKASGGTIDLA
jgi:hypothetical protein